MRLGSLAHRVLLEFVTPLSTLTSALGAFKQSRSLAGPPILHAWPR
jgi:hypothetical protein